MERFKPLLWMLFFVGALVSCQKAADKIDVERALKHQVDQESAGKLSLVSYQALRVKNDNPESPTIRAVTYEATVRSKQDLVWGSLVDNKQSRFTAFPEGSSAIMRNVERTKGGETKTIQYTIVFQKKDGKWLDQFGNAY